MQRSLAIWRSRRGLRELDLLLVPFAEARYESLNDAQRAAYAELLECDDHDIWSWLSGRETPLERARAEIVALIVAANVQRGALR
jgi:antitoxin CptB